MNGKRLIFAFLSGTLFAVGLGMSGMMLPEKVVGFLDFFGSWDPTLAFVMGGAVAVNFVLHRLVMRRGRPIFHANFELPTRVDLDPKLLGGAALFGAGWGLAGFCPGPALASTVGGRSEVLLFVASMIGGMFIWQVVDRLLKQRAVRRPPTTGASAAQTQS